MTSLGGSMGYVGLELEQKLLKKSNNLSFFQYENATYEIIFHHVNQQVIDEWLSEVARINCQYKPSDTVRYIVNTADMLDEDMPIFYVFRRSQDYVKANPARPITRTLIFHRPVDNHVLLPILNIFSAWLSGHRQEAALFLPIDKDAEGIAWLLRE